jgi:Tfp pilus assembly pilus retraction ATPase PilT
MQINAQQGMHTMDDALSEMVGKYTITLEEALTRCIHPDQMMKVYGAPNRKEEAMTGSRK